MTGRVICILFNLHDMLTLSSLFSSFTRDRIPLSWGPKPTSNKVVPGAADEPLQKGQCRSKHRE